MKVGVVSSILMREAITYSKLPQLNKDGEQTFKIPIRIPVSEDEVSGSGEGKSAQETSAT